MTNSESFRIWCSFLRLIASVGAARSLVATTWISLAAQSKNPNNHIRT
ncbi:hypothetical protein [Bradyrhizobium sp. LTSP849]|nr:hypothetical protein [Bradyrhizobium sp. LTSP849]